jgi:hypothetical protein
MESSQDLPVKDFGVLCSLAELPDGSMRLVLDDLKRTDEPQTWRYQSLFTFKDYGPGKLDPASRSEKELADFGYNVLVRLLASNGLGT